MSENTVVLFRRWLFSVRFAVICNNSEAHRKIPGQSRAFRQRRPSVYSERFRFANKASPDDRTSFRSTNSRLVASKGTRVARK